MSQWPKLIVSLCIVSFSNNIVEGKSRSNLIVNTKVGPIQGLQADDGDYTKFLGIPYAKINEANPFGASLSYPQFVQTFQAYNDSAECPQVSHGLSSRSTEKTLDCLRLNVFLPSSAGSENLLPVLVFIHGGGYSVGSGSSSMVNPKWLLQYDIIFVSVNYRLGPYGFMCLGTPEVPGNQGLKDQLAGIRWVKDHINAFGGDPKKITISGQSAGSMSIGFHIHSDPEKVFNQVIMESGTSLIPEAPLETNPTSVLKLAALVGHNTTDISNALKFLATADPVLVVDAASEMERFLPCVEKKLNNIEAFLTDYPINLKIPKVKDMNILIGVNSQEMSSGTDIYEALKWAFTFNEKDLEKITRIVKEFYIGDEEYAVSKLASFDSDMNFNYPADRSVSRFIENEASKVFYYVFSHVGELNNSPPGGLGVDRVVTEAGHGAELSYLYYSLNKESQPNAADQLMINRMTTMWTNFVKYGDPTPQTTDILPVKWQPVIKDSPKYYMNLTIDLQLSTRPFRERMSFWNLFFNRNENLQRGYKNTDSAVPRENNAQSFRSWTWLSSLAVPITLKLLSRVHQE